MKFGATYLATTLATVTLLLYAGTYKFGTKPLLGFLPIVQVMVFSKGTRLGLEWFHLAMIVPMAKFILVFGPPYRFTPNFQDIILTRSTAAKQFPFIW